MTTGYEMLPKSEQGCWNCANHNAGGADAKCPYAPEPGTIEALRMDCWRPGANAKRRTAADDQ